MSSAGVSCSVSAGGPPADDEPLGQIDEMRRRIPRRAMSGRGQCGVDHRDHRPLAIGTGDVDRPERPFGVAQLGDEGLHVVEPELDAELFEPEQPVDGIEGLRIQ